MVTFHVFALHQSLFDNRLFTFWYIHDGQKHVQQNRSGLQLSCLRIALEIKEHSITEFRLKLYEDIKSYTAEYSEYVQKLISS